LCFRSEAIRERTHKKLTGPAGGHKTVYDPRPSTASVILAAGLLRQIMEHAGLTVEDIL